MSAPQLHIFEFGDFRVEAHTRRLLHKGDAVPLTPKVFDTLLYLVENRGKVVEKDDLMRAVWPDTVVEENNLNQNISTLRRVLGESRGENRFIATIPGKGYRFIAPVGLAPAALGAIPTRVTLAALPFENLSADPQREYLADGLTEETIATLGQIDPHHLSVIGRTSVMSYKRTTKSLAEIGHELDAAYLIESSIRAEGGHLRITSKLIRVSDQVQIWSASYDSEPSSMLAFQRELSAAIAEQVHLHLSPDRLSALARRHSRNAEAYDLYLRGRHFWNQLTPPATRRAIEYFGRAAELDPSYALAWSGLADSYCAGPINGDAPPLAVWPRAKEAAANAIKAEPALAEVQTSLGFLKFWLEWDWPGAEAAFRKAVSLDPSYPLPHRMIGILLSHMGRPEEARPAIRRARELDPLLAVHQALSSQVAFSGREYSEAVQFARQSIVVDPEFWVGYMQLAQALEQLDQTDQALDALTSAGRFSGGNSKVVALRGYIFAKLGRTAEAREVLRTLVAIARERYVPPYAMALVHAGLSEPDDSFEWLDRAFDLHDVHLIFLPVDPKWDPFRGDARFAALLNRAGLPIPVLPAVRATHSPGMV
ncbi:MAG TPA: winged helix-turn-helix domain-containing protein [Candidatus Acidoferrum sp.]|nr:winged helix-turn-helix domain-containing protein [Candidatus Acidoferrum sp.]